MGGAPPSSVTTTSPPPPSRLPVLLLSMPPSPSPPPEPPELLPLGGRIWVKKPHDATPIAPARATPIHSQRLMDLCCSRIMKRLPLDQRARRGRLLRIRYFTSS